MKMALVLMMQEGRSFYLNDLQVTVEKIITPTRATLVIDGAIIQKVTIGPNHRTELMPGIYAQIGMTQDNQDKITDDTSIDTVKVALEAPRNIKILRDNLYDAQD